MRTDCVLYSTQEDAASETMATLIDLLRHLGQHAAPDGSSALVGPIVLPGISDSPLTLTQPSTAKLVAAWSREVGRITLGHHALALSAAQTNYSVALMGHGNAPHDDLVLLLLAQLQRQPQQTALCIVAQQPSAFYTRLTKLADTIELSWLDATQPGARVRPAALVITTPNELHRRVLRFHDRAWRWLWPHLHVVALPELQRAAGVTAGHLHWVLRRAGRLRPDPIRGTPLHVFSSLAPVADVEATLARLLPEEIHQPLRVIAAPDGPSHNTLIALWRHSGDRAAAITRLADQLRARHVPVAILGRDLAETEQLRATVASGAGQADEGARVAIVSGVPTSSEARQALLRSGYRLVLLLAGDEPHELLYAAQPELLLQVLPYWPVALANPYISAAQLVCAAAERPLEEAEIDRWHLRDLRDRLLRKGSLQPLPGADLWQSSPEGSEPYANLDLRTIGGTPAELHDPDGNMIGTIAPTLLDRCALPGQMFAPGLRVAHRDEQTGVVRLAVDTSGAATVVLADLSVTVREEQAARTLHFGKVTAELTKGKVLATQQIVGLRELRRDGSEQRLPLRAISETQWSAAACWIELPPGATARDEFSQRATPPFRSTDPHTLGWSISAVLPQIALAPPGALIVAYVADQQRLYLIEAEPGGIGLISGVYDQFERMIQLAGQLTVACAERPQYARIAANELTWLRMLSVIAAQPTVDATPAPEHVEDRDSEPRTPRILPFPTRRPTPEPSAPAQTEQPAVSAADGSGARRSALPQSARTRIYAPSRPIAPAQPRLPAATDPANSVAAAHEPSHVDHADETVTPAQPQHSPKATSQPLRPAAIAAPHAAPPADDAIPAPTDAVLTPVDTAEPRMIMLPTPKTAPPAAAVQPPVGRAMIYSVREEPRTEPVESSAAQEPPPAQANRIEEPPAIEPVDETAASEVNQTAIQEPPAIGPVDERKPPVAEQIAMPESPVIERVDEDASFVVEQAEIAETTPVEQAEIEELLPPSVEPSIMISEESTLEEPPIAGPDQIEEPPQFEEPLPQFEELLPPIERPLTVVKQYVSEPPVVAEQPESFEEAQAAAEESATRAEPIVVRTRWDEEDDLPSSIAVPPTQGNATDAATPDEVEADEEEAEPEPAAPTAPQPVVERRHEQRRWPSAASAQFRIDDLLPPVPDEQDDDTDEIEPDQPAASGTERPTAPPAAIDRKQPEPRDTPRRAPLPAQPPRRFAERPAAQRPNNTPPRRDRPAGPRDDARSQAEPPRSNPPQPSNSRHDSSGYSRHNGSGPRRTPPQPTPPPSRRDEPLHRAGQPPRRADQPPSRHYGSEQSDQPTEQPRRQSGPVRPSNTPPRPADRPTPAPARQPAPQPEPAQDVGAMIDRMRRLRQQREAEQQSSSQHSRPAAARGADRDDASEPAELRFHIGERVQCLPYGVGTVRASRIAEGRELVQIEFPDYGEIEVDPAISLVRQLGAPAHTADDLDTSQPEPDEL